MSFSIQTNVNSLIAQENLRVNSNFQSETIQRLTSGYRINQSGDDAAGLAIANKFRSDTAELAQGVRNANDGVSQLQIMDGGINNIGKMLDRLKTLATQSASATFTGDRGVLNKEYQTLVGEIDRQAQGIGLSTGGHFAQSVGVYIGGGATAAGAADTANGTVSLDLANSVVDSKALGLRTSQFTAQPVSGTNLAVASNTSIANIISANGASGAATALMGHFDSTATNAATGASVSQTVTGSALTVATTAESVTLKVLVNGTAHNVSVTLAGTEANAAAMLATVTGGAGYAALSALGVTAQLDGSGTKLQFVGNSNQSIEVQAAGDKADYLGLGAWSASSNTLTGSAAAVNSNG